MSRYLEPTDAELARIEAASAITDAEVALVDAECQVAADPTSLVCRLALAAARHDLAHARAAHQPLQIGA